MIHLIRMKAIMILLDSIIDQIYPIVIRFKTSIPNYLDFMKKRKSMVINLKVYNSLLIQFLLG